MNRLTIIGNVTRDPELRSTPNGVNVCSFTVAANRRRTQDGQQPEADFFNVSAWRQLGENCAKYLTKGKKVCVIGPVSIRTFSRNDGTPGASMEVLASEVEFLSPQSASNEIAQNNAVVPQGFTRIDDPEGLPF